MPLKLARAALAAGLGLVGLTVGIAPVAAVDATSPARLSIAVPVVAPITETGIIDADALALYTGPSGVLTRQLDAVAGRTVAIGVDPMIIVSIRLLGSSAPPSATAWLNRLDAVQNEVFPLTYADSDLTLGTQAGSPTALTPLGFDFALDPALFQPATEETPTPAPDPVDPALPPLPTEEDLVDWQYTFTDIAWPRDGTVTAADLQAIAASGYSTTIVSSANVAREGDGTSAEAEGTELAVSHDEISAALRTAATAVGADLSAAVTALRDLVVATGGEHTTLATMNRVVRAGRLGEVLDALEADPLIDLVPLSEAIDGEPDSATVVDLPHNQERLARASAMLTTEGADQRFATIAENPAAITADRRLRLLALFSNAWETNAAGWNGSTQGYIDDSVALRASVSVAVGSPINLVGDQRTSLPIPIANALDQPVRVFVTVRPTTALLSVMQQRVEIVVPANSQASAQVPVQAISNGSVVVVVTLTSADGVAVSNPAYVDMNVQAGWETPIVIGLAVLVVLVFGIGIVRTILRRRRDRDARDD